MITNNCFMVKKKNFQNIECSIVYYTYIMLYIQIHENKNRVHF